ncbi:MAG: SpoVR family protein, partial [Firmicutes bacterium]|nr:SpoVR family protein [Bacillota bacterium]
MLDNVESLQGFLDRAWEEAETLGLRPHPVEFEVVPSTAIFELASYGMPGHWSHWTYGRDYWQFKQRMESGHGRLYEMVVNTNPAHAYLLDSNTVAAQKLVVAHVLGHSDVFANHERFRDTPKDMDRSMAAARERFAEYEAEYGADRLERLLDAALSLSAQVAPDRPAEGAAPAGAGAHDRYRDLFGDGDSPHPAHRRRAPYPLPTYDVLGFLARHSPVLEEWERDVLEAVRREALYFEPQRVTKLVNEGYATLVHNTLLSRLPIGDDEALEAARVHAQVI